MCMLETHYLNFDSLAVKQLLKLHLIYLKENSNNICISYVTSVRYVAGINMIRLHPWMTIVESAWNVWMECMGVASGCG